MAILELTVNLTQLFTEIMDEMRQVYLKDSKRFVVLYSGGKDSSLVLALVWLMLLSLPESLRTKEVYVVTSATGVETPDMTAFIATNIANIQAAANEQNLPIVTRLVKPPLKHSFFVQTIGKGNPAPMETSPFKWCVERLKLDPVDKFVEELGRGNLNTLFDQHDLLMLLGVRDEESARRRASINKFALEDKFARHRKHDRVLMYHPIRYVTLDDLWGWLFQIGTLPWGMDVHQLFAMYSNTGECPMTQTDKGVVTCGGSSRNGCWTCLVGGRNDKMLIERIENGDHDLIPLLAWKQLSYDVRIDIRLRESLRRIEEKRFKTMSQQVIANQDQLRLFNDEEEFHRVEQWVHAPGSITLEGRKLLLQRLLYAEQQSGHQLISRDEIDAIVEAWRADGYDASATDLQPVNRTYDGPLVIHPDGRLNETRTQLKSPVFDLWEDFDLSQEELILFLKQRALLTGKTLHFFMASWEAPGLVVNSVQFVLAEPGISTTQDAREFLDSWLGWTDQREVC